jgi:hypothetical protein
MSHQPNGIHLTLAQYESSDDDDKTLGKATTKSSSHQTSNASHSSISLLTSPSTSESKQSCERHKIEDEDERTKFAEAQRKGQWAVHISLPLPDHAYNQLGDLVEAVLEDFQSKAHQFNVTVVPLGHGEQPHGNQFNLNDPKLNTKLGELFPAAENWKWHVSISKSGCVRVRRFQISQLIKLVKQHVMASTSNLISNSIHVQLDQISILKNDQHTRAFICLTFGSGNTKVRIVISALSPFIFRHIANMFSFIIYPS